MDFIGEILLELLFELIVWLLGVGAMRAARAVGREAAGTGEQAIGWLIVSWAAPIATGLGLGLWRGSLADGRFTWGWWLTVAVVVGCLIGLVRAESASEPPSDPWRRTLRWWPKRRLGWFLAGNLSFALAYLLAR